jgi:hypothetical protein
MIGLLLNATVASIGLAFPGEPVACPDRSKEVATIPYIRQTTGGIECETVVTVMNLNKKIADVTVQFFTGIGPSQDGVDATDTLSPGESVNISGAGADPLGIFIINADAATTGVEGSARVCSTAKALSIDATLVCDVATGPVMKDLKVVLKKQKGD